MKYVQHSISINIICCHVIYLLSYQLLCHHSRPSSAANCPVVPCHASLVDRVHIPAFQLRLRIGDGGGHHKIYCHHVDNVVGAIGAMVSSRLHCSVQLSLVGKDQKPEYSTNGAVVAWPFGFITKFRWICTNFVRKIG